MNRRTLLTSAAIALATRGLPLPSFVGSAWAQEMPAEYQQALQILDKKKGDFKANVLKVNVPRNDLSVVVDGVATPTPSDSGAGWPSREAMGMKT